MCFYVGIVLPPSFFLYLVTFVLNKLSFSPQIILFLKSRPSIHSVNNGTVNLTPLTLCCVYSGIQRPREVGSIGSEFRWTTSVCQALS